MDESVPATTNKTGAIQVFGFQHLKSTKKTKLFPSDDDACLVRFDCLLLLAGTGVTIIVYPFISFFPFWLGNGATVCSGRGTYVKIKSLGGVNM